MIKNLIDGLISKLGTVKKITEVEYRSIRSIQGVPVVAPQKRIRLGTMRLLVRSLASLSGLKIWCCCELWCRSQTQLRSGVAAAVAVAAVALTGPLAWEPPYAAGAALKSKKEDKPKTEPTKEYKEFPLGAAETNPTRNHEVVGLIPGLTQWVKDLTLP